MCVCGDGYEGKRERGGGGPRDGRKHVDEFSNEGEVSINGIAGGVHPEHTV